MNVLADLKISFQPMNWPEALVLAVFIIVAGLLLWKMLDDDR